MVLDQVVRRALPEHRATLAHRDQLEAVEPPVSLELLELAEALAQRVSRDRLGQADRLEAPEPLD